MEFQFKMPSEPPKENLRVIKTARTVNEINKGADEGFWPLIRKVEPSKEISTKYCVYQNEINGKVDMVCDYRIFFHIFESADNPHEFNHPHYNKVIDWTYHYPYRFPSPFAAYLIPKDIQVGEVVLLEDLIEDHVGDIWNQGDVYRLPSCKATWDGKDLILDLPPVSEHPTIYG